MHEATVEALKESIEHWKRNCVAKTPDDASVAAYDCALCNMFDMDATDDDEDGTGCRGCPVRDHTGHADCGGTPYGRAAMALRLWKTAITETEKQRRDDFHAAAKKEVKFLQGLLP